MNPDPKAEHPTPPVGSATEVAPPTSDFDGDPGKLVRSPQNIGDEAPHPLYCVWEITLKCDLSCKHCGSRAGKARPDELSTEACLDVVHQLAEMGVREVTLIGGEAYLREDWDVIAAEVTRLGMVCGMTTGARNLTQERVDRAAAAGMRVISTSIDGLEATHDAQRGAKGSWRAAVEAARRVADSPIRLATNTQINQLSMPEMPALAELLVELGSRAWQVQLTVPMGRGADHPSLPLQPYHLLELFPLLVYIKQRILDPAGIQMFPGNNIGYFGPYERLLRYGGERGAHWTSCSAGKWCIGLEADGAIKACPSLPTREWTGGNLTRDRLADTVFNAPELTHLKNRTIDDLWGFCRTCAYAETCRAGCTWTSECITGKPGNNPYCIHRALQFEKQGLRERLEKVAAAPGLPFDFGRFEITVEPLETPGEAAPSVLGVPLDEVRALRWNSAGAWDAVTIAERLTRESPAETD